MKTNVKKIEFGRIPRKGFCMICPSCKYECQDLIRLARNKDCPNCGKPMVYKTRK